MSSITNLPWQEIALEHEFAEELGEALIPPALSMHAAIQVESPTCIRVSVHGGPELVQPLLDQAQRLNFRILEVRERSYEPTRALVRESWQRLDIGTLSVIAVQEIRDHIVQSPEAREIYILPGTGWGTGSHPTTSLPLELMQREPILREPPERVLDLGCGSGILAIAAEKLYGASVDAVDIDPLALENARVNLSLNASSKVRLFEGSIECVTGSYDLIVANIYAQVLLPLASRLKEVMNPGGNLILSGLSESSLDERQNPSPTEDMNGALLVLAAYEKHGWSKLETRSRLGWVAFHFVPDAKS